MKICTKCKEKKVINFFGKDVNKPDGLNSWCRFCISQRNKESREKNPEYFKEHVENYREKNREKIRENAKTSYYLNWEKRREQGKISYNKRKEEIAKKRAEKRSLSEEKEKNRIRQKEWRALNKSRVAEVVTGWKKRNPQKHAAHAMVMWAIKGGFLIKPTQCQECKETKSVEGHHLDYSKPLDVVWLCKSCHSKKHKIYR